MNYLTNKTFKVKGGRLYTEGTIISGVEYNNLDEEHQGNFEETNITDIGQTQEQADEAQELFEKMAEAKKERLEAFTKRNEPEESEEEVDQLK